MTIIIPLGIISLIFATYLISRKGNNSARLLHELDKNQKSYDYYKIMPYDIAPMQITQDKIGNYSISLTPISIIQIDNIFQIKVRSKHEKGEIEFDLIIDNLTRINNISNRSVNLLCLNTDNKNGNNLLFLLAELFEIPIENNKEIISNINLRTNSLSNYNVDSILKNHNFITTFLPKGNNSNESPELKIEIDFPNEKIYLKEVNTNFRKSIIDELIFVPNIISN